MAALSAAALAGLCALAVLGYVPGVIPALGWGVAGALLSRLGARAWLCVFPALVPVLSFAPRTGSMFVEEFDLVLLGALLASVGQVGAWQRVPIWAVPWGVSWLVALGVGLAADGGPVWDVAQLATYHTPWNALRVGKAWVLAWLTWPHWARAVSADAAGAARLFMAGNAAGLGWVALVCVWERAAFPGLTNFSSDYRTTGPFWEMHVGGAALDGFLALTLPCALWWLARRPGWRSAGLTGVAHYALFSTFSRGLYVAWVALAAVLVACARVPRMWAWALAAVALVWPLDAVFATGGYRALLAVCAVGAMAVWVGGQPRTLSLVRWALGVGVGAGVSAALIGGLARGVYVAFAMALAACVWACWRKASWGLAAFGCLAGLAVGVAVHWGGPPAAVPSLVVVGAAVGAVLASVWRPQPLWRVRRGVLVLACGALGVGGCGAVLHHSAFVDARFDRLVPDLSARITHWSQVMDQVQAGTRAQWWLGWVGHGLGRWPTASGAHMAQGGHTLTHAFSPDEGLVLRMPQQGALDVLRVSQRLSSLPQEPLLFSARVRVSEPSRILLSVCFKHLLYADGCAQQSVSLSPAQGEWQQVVRVLDARTLKPGPWFAPRDAVLSISLAHGAVALSAVQLLGQDGDGVRNGDFRHGPAGWFFTSDHHHLPWHTKQLGLNVLFEQGVVGLLAFGVLLGGALLRLRRGLAAGVPTAPYLLAGLVGFMVVGAFDTLTDAPRLTWLFASWVWMAAMVPFCQRRSSSR